MKALEWHIHDGNPCSKCGCAFGDGQTIEKSEREGKIQYLRENIEHVKGWISDLERDLSDAEWRLFDLRRELKKLGGEEGASIQEIENHPWMQARKAARMEATA